MNGPVNRGLRRFYPLAAGLISIKRFLLGMFGGRTFGVRMLVLRNGQICLIRHSYGNRSRWMAPGGGVDWSEQPEHAAIRETAEEVGITDLRDVRIVHAYVHQIGRVDDIVVVYAGHTEQDFAYVSNEIEEIGWFSPDSLPETTTDGTRHALAALSGKAGRA